MKIKVIRIICIFLGIIALFAINGGINLFGRSQTAFAVGDLTIDWGVPTGDPIFVITNMLPGDVQEREVDVTNNATSSRSLAVKGVQTSASPSNFPDVLQIVITEGVNTIYGPVSLTQFFTDSSDPDGIALSTLPPSSNTTYKFKVTFDSSAGNEFQEAKVIFDLIIGIASDIPPECQNIEFSGSPIFGTSGHDQITGTNGNDLIFGLEGHDEINGGNGRDCIVGGPGHDQLSGGNGDDILLGSEGDDFLSGENGNDLLLGHDGDDYLDGGVGDDTLDGGPADQDYGDGKAGSDTCTNFEFQINCEP